MTSGRALKKWLRNTSQARVYIGRLGLYIIYLDIHDFIGLVSETKGQTIIKVGPITSILIQNQPTWHQKLVKVSLPMVHFESKS